MQSNITTRHFIVDLKNLEILVAESSGSLRIILTHPDSLSLAQQSYTEANIGTVVGGQFKRPAELFHYLQGLKNYPDRWFANELTSLQVVRSQTQVVRITLKVVADAGELAKLLLFKMSKPKEVKELSQAPDLGELKQEIAGLKNSYSSIGGKLKGIGELFETLRIDQERAVHMFEEERRAREALQVKVGSSQQRVLESLKKVEFSLDILEKTMHRSQTTIRSELQSISAELGKKIQAIQQHIECYNLPKIRQDMNSIARMFELQVKVKDHEFIPDVGLQRGSKKLHWLNKRILKNLEDVKDYNKVVGGALPRGISKLRFQVNVIKNNGLLLGVCNSKGRDGLESAAFNDQNFITLNSCGYVTNRGAMHMSNAKIKSKDIVKMVVNLSQGIIHWFCNDIEVAIADMGSMNRDQVFPMVGLGFFGDEVQVLQAQKPKESLQIHESYTHELQRLNEKFGKVCTSLD